MHCVFDYQIRSAQEWTKFTASTDMRCDLSFIASTDVQMCSHFQFTEQGPWSTSEKADSRSWCQLNAIKNFIMMNPSFNSWKIVQQSEPSKIGWQIMTSLQYQWASAETCSPYQMLAFWQNSFQYHDILKYICLPQIHQRYTSWWQLVMIISN